MSIFRSRNLKLSNRLIDKAHFNSMTFRKELNLTSFRLDKKKKNSSHENTFDTPCYEDVLKNIIKHNNFLKKQVSLLSTKNTNIKNFMRRILNINNEQNNKKSNIISYLKEYNNILSFNNKNLKLDVEIDKNNYQNIDDDMNNKISQLLIIKEEKEKIKFLFENDLKTKDNFIEIYSTNLKNIGNVQEREKFRYLNDEMLQIDIDNFYTKYLEIYRKNLLLSSQRWNKYKNKVAKSNKDIVELKKILKNPKEIKNNQIIEEQKNNIENSILSTEGDNDIFLMTFDEFEDDFEPGINEQDLVLNESNNNNNSNINITNIKEQEPKYSKINNRNLKKSNLNSNTIDTRTGNKINNPKKDLYYFPQNNYSKSILKEKTDSPRINPNKTISLNSISKLNFKQIVFNKNAKYMKEEAQNLAVKKFEIENEFELSKNNYENKNKILIKDLKKDIKLFKSKIKKKKKIIKGFNKFCNELYSKYQKFMKKTNDINNNET